MKHLTIAFLAATALFTVSACKKKGGGAGEAMAKMSEFADEMCKCKDKPCADKVQESMTKWATDMAAKAPKNQATEVPSEADKDKMRETSTKMAKCMTAAMGAGDPGGGSAAVAGEPQGTDKPAEVKPAAGAGFASDADYEAKGFAAFDKMMAIFAAAGTDCDKLAADMTTFITENKEMMEAADAYEAAHPDAKKALDAKMQAKMKEGEGKMGAAMEACKDSKALADAMSKLPE